MPAAVRVGRVNGAVLVACLVLCCLGMVTTAWSQRWQLEAGTVELEASGAAGQLGSVAFSCPFAQTPLVFVLGGTEDPAPSTVRIRNVGPAGFELVQVEPEGEDGPHGATTVHWLAVEPGVHELPDGSRVEAGSFSWSRFIAAGLQTGPDPWKVLTFTSGFYAAPAFLLQIQTMANETGAIPAETSRPWLVSAVKDLTGTGAQVTMERCEASAGSVGTDETLAWLAVEAGSGTLVAGDGLEVSYAALDIPATVRGMDDGCVRVRLPRELSSPQVVVGSLTSRNEQDGGWLRLCATGEQSVDLVLDEDKAHDPERAHHEEGAGLLAFSRPFSAMVGRPDLPTAAFEATAYTVAEGSLQATLTIALSEPAPTDVTVGWTTQDGSALAGSDYVAASGRLVIPEGESSGTLTVDLVEDYLVEPDETFVVALGTACGGVVGLPATATVTIVDLHSVSMARSDLVFLEGSSLWLTFQVVLSRPAQVPADVTFETVAGTAQPPGDFTQTMGVVHFDPPATVATGQVWMPWDTVAEPNKTFSVILRDPVNAILGNPAALQVTIIDFNTFQAYDLHALHVEPDLVHLLWQQTGYEGQCVSSRLYRRDADLAGAWSLLADWPSAYSCSFFWRDFLVETGVRYEYRAEPYYGSVTGVSALLALGAPLPPTTGQAVKTVLPALARALEPARPLPDGAHPFAGTRDYLFHLLPDPGPEFLPGTTVDLFVDEVPATADPDETYQPWSAPHSGLGRDDLACAGLPGAPVVQDQVCEGISCDVVIPALTPGVHRFRFVVHDSGGASERAIIQDMQPWWAPNVLTTDAHPRPFMYLFSPFSSTIQPGIDVQGPGAAPPADSLDCGDRASVPFAAVTGPSGQTLSAADARGVTRFAPTLTDGQNATWQVGWSSNLSLGRDLLQRGVSGAFEAGRQTASLAGPNLQYTLTVDVGLAGNVAPSLTWLTPTVAEEDGSPVLWRTVWLRLEDHDQDVDPFSVRVSNLDHDGGAEQHVAHYADASLQHQPWGAYGWFVCRLPLLPGGNHLRVQATDRSGHVLDDASHTLLRHVLVPGDYPIAVITRPDSGRYYGDGEEVTLDATGSTVPAGYQPWLGVLVEDGSNPMTLVASSASLSGSFTASISQAAYRIRLVLATADRMPGDEVLRGQAPPCVLGDPDLGCTSTEVVIHRQDASHLYPFELGHALPDEVFLLWGEVEKPVISKSSDGGQNWESLGASPTKYYYRDPVVTQGATYHYRASIAGGFCYLGNTTTSPGEPVSIPVWAAPRVFPQLDSVTWDCPQGASHYLCEGTLHMTLTAQGGGSLEGCAIRVFLNEPTFQPRDGRDAEIPIDWPANLVPFEGGDVPACVTRRQLPELPDLEREVPAGQSSIAVDLDGVIFGANGLRFEVSKPHPGGGMDVSERAILVALHDSPMYDDWKVKFPVFLPVLQGEVFASTSVNLRGLGPASRRSPDCGDGDAVYWWSRSPYYQTSLYFDLLNLQGQTQARLTTDEYGLWSKEYTLAEGSYTLSLEHTSDSAYYNGFVGRVILGCCAALRGYLYSDEHLPSVGQPSITLTVNTSISDHKPALNFVPPSVSSASEEEVKPIAMRFRITDPDHDVDLSSVRVYNCSLEDCDPGLPGQTPYPGFYAADQTEPGKNWGWFVAEVPFTLLGYRQNTLHVCAEDAQENPLGSVGEPCVVAVVTRTGPMVRAKVISASPSQADPWQRVTFSGTVFPRPEDLPGTRAWWVVLREVAGSWGLDPRYHDPQNPQPIAAEVDDGQTALSVTMPDHFRVKARLIAVIPSEPGGSVDLPAGWGNGTALPCTWDQSPGLCDSGELTVGMVDTRCSNLSNPPLPLTVTITQPDDYYPFTPDQQIHVLATTSPAPAGTAFRWVLYRADDLYRRWPVAYLEHDPNGDDGWSTVNNDFDFTPAGQGIPYGSWKLVCQARQPANGTCPWYVWYLGQSAIDEAAYFDVVPVPHSFDGVAPGQVVEGGTFRVYSHTLPEGDTAYVLFDDGDAYPNSPTPVLAYEGTVHPGGYIEVSIEEPEYQLEPGTYWVSVAESVDGFAGSDWYRALEVVAAGSADDPLEIPPEGEPQGEEDPSCGGEGTECAHPIVPGQTWQGEWGEAGDVDGFWFIAGEGTRVGVTLTALPPQDPDPPAPEILLVRPDGVVFAASAPLGLEDVGTALEATLPMSGSNQILVRTSKGAGMYRVFLEQLEEVGSGDAELGFTRDQVHIVNRAEIKRFLKAPLVDPFGQPLSNREVLWEQGDEGACPDGFCPAGTPSSGRSSRSGYAYLDLDVSAGVTHALARVTLPEDVARKFGHVDRSASLARASRAIAEQPILGWVGGGGDVLGPARLPDLATAKELTDQARFFASLRREGGGKYRDQCSHTSTCPASASVPFKVTELTLGQGETLVDLDFELRGDDGTPVKALGGDGVVVMSEVGGLEVRTMASVAVDGVLDPDPHELTLPVRVRVTRDFEGTLQLGDAVCPTQVTTTSTDSLPFSYLVGNYSRFHYSHLDEQGEPCCWHTTEYLVAEAKVAVQVDDGQGGTTWLPRSVELDVPSTPREAEPCEVRARETGTVASYDNVVGLQVGSVYLVDYCDNIVALGSERPLTTTLRSAPPEMSVEAVGNPYDWEYDLVFRNTEFDQGGSYVIDIETDSTSPECSSGGKIGGSFTAVTEPGRAKVILLWDCGGGLRNPSELASPASALPDQSGQVAVWRVPAFQTSHLNENGAFPGEFTAVPVKLYVTDALERFDLAGNFIEDGHFAPVEGVELCTGIVEKQADQDGVVVFGAPVRTTCNPAGTTVVTASAFSEPPASPTHEAWSWVTMGLGVGVTKAPEQQGWYLLVVEPVNEPFRGGDAWEMTSSFQPDGVVGFMVGGAQFMDESFTPIHDPITVLKPRTIHAKVVMPDVGPTAVATLRYTDEDGAPVSTTPLDLTRLPGSGNTYMGEFELIPEASKARDRGRSTGASKLLDAPQVTAEAFGDISLEVSSSSMVSEQVVPKPDITVEEIAFNWDETSDEFDGMNIRVDYDQEVEIPEFTAFRDRPAAYTAGALQVEVLVKLHTASSRRILRAEIAAESTLGTVLGSSSEPKEVFFVDGASQGVDDPSTPFNEYGFVHFTFPLNAGAVTKSQEGWQWSVTHVGYEGDPSIETYPIGTTEHTVYVVLDDLEPPQAHPSGNPQWAVRRAWTQSRATQAERCRNPWTVVLDLACVWAAGRTTPESVAEAVTAGPYSGQPQPSLLWRYDQQYSQTLGLNCDLKDLLLPGATVDCRDMAALVQVLSQSLGLQWVGHRVIYVPAGDPLDPVNKFKTRSICVKGSDCSQAESWHPWTFEFHWFASVVTSEGQTPSVFDATMTLRAGYVGDEYVPAGVSLLERYLPDLMDPEEVNGLTYVIEQLDGQVEQIETLNNYPDE